MQFSTYEQDNDVDSGRNCAADYGGNGGNWNRYCFRQNMNGKYGADGDAGDEFMYWGYFDFDTSNDDMALKSMRWMMREVV